MFDNIDKRVVLIVFAVSGLVLEGIFLLPALCRWNYVNGWPILLVVGAVAGPLIFHLKGGNPSADPKTNPNWGAIVIIVWSLIGSGVLGLITNKAVI